MANNFNYAQALMQGGGAPVNPMQQPQFPNMDMNMLMNIITKIIGNPEQGLIRMQRPQNLPNNMARYPQFFMD